MIEHADAALEAWLSTLDPPVEVTFERPGDDGGRGAKRPVLSLVLTRVREQIAKRDNQVTDLRSAEGRVVGRQAATRFFELDYVCSVAGPALDAHRALGDVLQLLVDHDVVPVEHVPDELSALGYPIDVQLVSPPASVAAVSVRVVLPVQPTPNRQIGPPATSLHLDMGPPPEPKVRGTALVPVAAPPSDDVVGPLPERKWTTVRRRELITREQHAAAKDDGKPAQKAGKKGA